MSGNAIVYGSVVTGESRRDIDLNRSVGGPQLRWFDEPRVFGSKDDVSLVFVDLDDDRFARPDFLVSLATAGEQVRVIGKADNATMEQTLQYSKLGVSEILTPDECLLRLNDFVGESRDDNSKPKSTAPTYNVDALVGESSQMKSIRKTIRLLRDVDFPSSLILGETGTGKGLIAKILHNTGMRKRHNLVEVNCSAISDELFESELYGHVKGAFTDAKSDKMGLFEYAQGGTLFLDEVGNLSDSAQAKLLKVLEDKKLRKVGAVEEKEINVRVVAATNLDLQNAVEDQKFRRDLYYRLNLLTITIPPLRERPEDIPAIIEHYIGYYATLYGKPSVFLTDDALAKMREYSWPGNVRELCNIIERAVLLSRGDKIAVSDISTALNKGRLSIADRSRIVIDVPPQGISLEEIEQSAVKQVLNLCNWNKTETAKFLHISRPRLRRIIDKAGLKQDRRSR